jgi:hypothetical protein
MSQFSRKYYKNDYKLEDNPKLPVNNYNDHSVWTFWRVWGLYEYLVLLLLGIIVFLLLTQQSRSVIIQKSFFVQKEQKRLSSSPQKETIRVQESTFPKKILPANPLPKKTILNGKTLYGPLTMEEYLYFADDVNNFYPDFFDEKSRKSHTGSSCKNSNCHLTTEMLDELHMAAYVQWLSDTTATNYTFIVKDNNYYIKKR